MPDDRLFHTCLGQSDKVNSLTDFEELVWRDYINTADDFGVMRFAAVAIQAKFDRMARQPAKKVERALERVYSLDLIRTFTHQNRVYCYQPDWQDWQHITYPRRTAQPLPSGDALQACSLHSRWLFTMHPDGGKLEGGWKAAKGWAPPEIVRINSGVTPESVPINSGLARTALAVSRSVSREPLAISREPAQAPEPENTLPLDKAFEQFKAAYPGHRRVGNFMTEQRFIDACQRIGFPALLAKLEEQKRSEEWQKPAFIPSMGKWFEDKHYEREPAPESSQEGLSKVTESAMRAFRDAQ